MQIWVDADACPKVIKDILFRAAERRRIPLILVANKPLNTPRQLKQTTATSPSPQSSANAPGSCSSALASRVAPPPASMQSCVALGRRSRQLLHALLYLPTSL